MSAWVSLLIATVGIAGRAAYLVKVRHYRYYASVLWEIDRLAEPERFRKVYRREILFCILFGLLVTVQAIALAIGAELP